MMASWLRGGQNYNLTKRQIFFTTEKNVKAQEIQQRVGVFVVIRSQP